MSEKIRTFLESSTASAWLKAALRAALEREAVAAADDAQLLYALLLERADEERGSGSVENDVLLPTPNPPAAPPRAQLTAAEVHAHRIVFNATRRRR